MAITITLEGTDLKIDDGSQINYRPVSDVRQRVVGTTIELYENGERFRADLATDYSSPSGTAEQIADAISQFSSEGNDARLSAYGGSYYISGTHTSVDFDVIVPQEDTTFSVMSGVDKNGDPETPRT